MADVQIRFQADSQNAKREINQLTKEIRELRQSLGQTNRTATETSQVVDFQWQMCKYVRVPMCR